MALTPGTRLGSYEVQSPLGAGGMGEVYRATDTVLGRPVALKVLPDSFAGDADRLARFEREARMLAALNHPNIAQIYGIERSTGVHALVMELVEGPTLADPIAQGALPLDEALAIARQVAEALDAAHEQGIVHRDLKPANIKVRPDGTVKVLDFGLAKALEPPGPVSSSVSQSPTITTPALVTGVGVILGTAAYMSPEQAKGRPVDKRADIWAFGCVLYEMLTGKRAFDGEDVADVLARVLEREPDLASLPASTPPPVRRLLRRCLAKDRRRRLPDIGVARLELDEKEDAVPVPATAAAAQHGLLDRGRLAWGLFAMACATALGLGLVAFTRTPEPPAVETPVLRTSIDLPGPLGGTEAGARFALSPDGRRLAFVAPGDDGQTMLWVRPLESTTAQPLAGTEGAAAPFWSPDSQSVAFIAGGMLKRIEASGGTQIILCPAAYIAPGSWNRENVILFTPRTNSGLYRVAATGGAPQPVTSLDEAAAEARHSYPFFLPDGRRFLFLATGGGGTALGVYIGSLDTTERSRVLDEGSNTVYVNGYLLFVRSARLTAQALDLTRLTLSGEAVPLADDIPTEINSRAGAFGASEAGLLVYQTGGLSQSRLTWFDRNGGRTDAVGTPERYGELALSDNGEYASMGIRDSAGGMDMWILEIARGLRTRFTFDAADEGFSVWSPDGRQIAFSSRRSGRMDLYVKAANGTGADESLLADDLDKFPDDWSPDGRFILYRSNSPSTASDLWLLPLTGDRRPFAFLQTPFSESNGHFSPDGRWVTYTSNRSGRNEVYVTSFPGAELTRQVSTMGGTQPKWSPTGGEIFYRSAGRLIAVGVEAQGTDLRVGAEHALFAVPGIGIGRGPEYAVSPDGQRFLFNVREESPESRSMMAIANWPGLLRR